jgi:Asp/Glu/hydantoin racemase
MVAANQVVPYAGLSSIANDCSMSRIIVINPNSSRAMTETIDRRLDRLRRTATPDIVCLTLEEGPPAIENEAHCRQVIAPLCRLVSSLGPVDAVVIACFSDPGISELRALVTCPVFGFCEAAVATAIGLGGRYGILTNLDEDIPDEMTYLRASELEHRLAGIEAIGVPVSGLAHCPDVLPRMMAAVARLEARGAGSVVLGCAGFSAFAGELDRGTGARIIDPTIAAVSLAIAATVRFSDG